MIMSKTAPTRDPGVGFGLRFLGVAKRWRWSLYCSGSVLLQEPSFPWFRV